VLLMLYEPRGLLGDGSYAWRALRAGWTRIRTGVTSVRSYAANP
jgi:hypothetical protein